MDTITAIRTGKIITPVPIQIMFGGCPIDPEFVDVFGPEPRWDHLYDEKLDARCASL